jgi:MraZ protein
MFVGKHFRTIDSKGRIFIPVKFREDLVKGVILSQGFGGRCLFMFSKEGWKNMEEKIKSKKVSEINTLEFSRWFSSSASEESLDQQGRTRIPPELIKYAGLKKDIVIVGQPDRAEIWDKEAWLKYYEKIDSKFKSEKAIEQLDL